MSKKTIRFPVQWMGGDSSHGFSKAQKNIKDALEMQGVEITYIADDELVHMSSHLYQKSKSVKNSYLWFPYEADEIVGKFIDRANVADHVIASCNHNKDVFENNGLYRPVSVCNMGINIDRYKHAERIHKDKFVFLWIGMNSFRKGWELLAHAFSMEFRPNEPVFLYMKTTSNEKQDLLQLHENVFVDTRNISEADLLDLYYDAHAFVFPSRGEATGLPAMEAMSTGALVLAPPIMGMRDFINDDTAIPLYYEYESVNYGLRTKAPSVPIAELRQAMRIAYEEYGEFKQQRRNGSSHIMDNFSLEKMGKRLTEIIWNE